MTYQRLREIIAFHNIPEDVKLMSDSGWECSATEMDGVYYNASINTIVFTQEWEEWGYEGSAWEYIGNTEPQEEEY